MSAEDDGKRESEDDLPDPDAPPEAGDPPMPKPESAAAAAKERRIQLAARKAAMKKRLAGREAEAQGLAQELAARNLEMEEGKKGRELRYVVLSHRSDRKLTLWTSKASTWH